MRPKAPVQAESMRTWSNWSNGPPESEYFSRYANVSASETSVSVPEGPVVSGGPFNRNRSCTTSPRRLEPVRADHMHHPVPPGQLADILQLGLLDLDELERRHERFSCLQVELFVAEEPDEVTLRRRFG